MEFSSAATILARPILLTLILSTEVLSRELAVLSPSGQTILLPKTDIEFTCYASMGSLSSVSWYVNDVPYNAANTSFNGIIDYDSDFAFGSFSIHRVSPSLNDTRIKCVGSFTSGNTIHSLECHIIVQDTLKAVRNLSINEINRIALLTWKPPHHYMNFIPAPSHYCVDIYEENSRTPERSMLLSSYCNIQNTSFEYYYDNIEITQCHYILYSITPINIVGNGTTNSISQSENFNSADLPTVVRPVDVTVQTMSAMHQVKIEVTVHQQILQCSMTFTDIESNNIYSFSSNEVVCSGNDSYTLISLSTTQLPLRKRFNVSINITNCVGYTVSHIFVNSFIVQMVSFNNFKNNSLSLNITYSEIQQGCSGVLVIIIWMSNMLNTYSYFSIQRNTKSFTDRQILGPLQQGSYKVHIYEMSNTGYFVPGHPVLTYSGNILTGVTSLSANIMVLNYCSVEILSNNNVKINCTLSEDHAHKFTANHYDKVIGYSVIIQPENDNELIITGELVGISSTIIFTLLKTGNYRITVFPAIGSSFDHSFLRHADKIFHKLINITNGATHEAMNTNKHNNIENGSRSKYLIVGCVLGSSVFYILGLLTCFAYKLKILNKANTFRGRTNNPEHPIPLYEDINQGSQIQHRNLTFELEQNLAYGDHHTHS